ncbi:MAG TPA: SDR family oxidoreductase [Jatrophihabitans sp.]|jgi:NAD(P)-dependent dehydrogenase (short-subunit alcohol dehydrogenase family)
MSTLNAGRVAIVTGAGAGIGRSHALALAKSGAAVVVNDVAAAAAQSVVDEIVAAGAQAAVSTDDISTDGGAKALIDAALNTFGDLHILVNNAGILRDKMFVNMTEQEWDAVIAVHLKGTFGPSRHAALHWREQSKAGKDVDARIINTTSASGVFGNVGQSNYGAAKAGIAAFTIILSMELERYGVTVNAVAPRALTAMTENLARYQQIVEAGEGESRSPDHISPVVVWLGSPSSREVTGRVFGITGTEISVYEGWRNGPTVNRDGGQWDPAELASVLPDLVKQARPNADMTGEVPKS